MLKKITVYTLVYIIISFVMSYDEIQCAVRGETLCWINLIGKFFIFMLLMLVFDNIIRPVIFKKRN